MNPPNSYYKVLASAIVNKILQKFEIAKTYIAILILLLHAYKKKQLWKGKMCKRKGKRSDSLSISGDVLSSRFLGVNLLGL